MPELNICTLPQHQADTPAQVTFSLALLEELFSTPGRLKDPAFTGYLLGLFDGEGKVARDQFVAVCILGFRATVNAMYGGDQGKYLSGSVSIDVPEGLELPPLLADGLDLPAVFRRDYDRDKAARVRLLTGQHVGKVNIERLTIGRATLTALAGVGDMPGNVRANLLAAASFLQWMEGDAEGANTNVALALLADPDNELVPLLHGIYQTHTPLWRGVQDAREEVG